MLDRTTPKIAPEERDPAKENSLAQQCWAEEINPKEAANKTMEDLKTLTIEERLKIYECIVRKLPQH